MFESILGSVAGPIVDAILDFGGKTVGTRLSALQENLIERRKFATAVERYVKNYKELHGNFKFLNTTPINLESVYVEAQIVRNYGSRMHSGPIEVDESLRAQRFSRDLQHKQAQTFDARKIAEKLPRIAVLGAPGSGKTSFLKMLGLKSIENYRNETSKDKLLPVFIELKNYENDIGDLEIFDLIVKEFESLRMPSERDLVGEILGTGKLLILLDGLDEVPDRSRVKVFNHIDGFVKKYTEIKIVVSCRTAAYGFGGLRSFTDIVLSEFTWAQAKEYINNWFIEKTEQAALSLVQEPVAVREKIAQKFIGILEQPESLSIRELSRTPLLLHFLCIFYEEKRYLPRNRSELYAEALRIILDVWTARRRTTFREFGLSTDIEMMMLSKIAFEGFKKDRLLFSGQHLINQISEFLVNMENPPKGLDGKDILAFMEVHQGILVKRNHSVYSFSHVSFQEFLTARYLEKNSNLFGEVVNTHLYDTRWRETFVLMSGLTESSDTFLGTMASKIQIDLRQSTKLCRLINWIGIYTSASNKTYKPFLRRFLIFCLFGALIHARFRTIVYTKNRDKQLEYGFPYEAYTSFGLPLNRIFYICDNPDAYGIGRELPASSALSIALKNVVYLAFDLCPECFSSRTIRRSLETAIFLKKTGIFKDAHINFLLSNLKPFTRQAIENSQYLEVRHKLLLRLQNVWFKAFCIDPKFLTFSVEEMDSMSDYLDAIILLLECKNSAMYATKTTWRKIETAMISAANY